MSVVVIDPKTHKLIDLSLEIVPNQTDPYRPFEVVEGRLGDGTRKFDITNTHTHVGTHIESPWHFYGGDKKTCTDFPLEKFVATATLLKGQPAPGADRVSLDNVRDQLEPRRGLFNAIVVRNEPKAKHLRFAFECVPYFTSFDLDLFIFDSTIEFGEGPDDGHNFHDLMLSRDILLVEFPANLHNLHSDLFQVCAMPLNIRKLDSSACRLFAILPQ